jgi:hypothetical protein
MGIFTTGGLIQTPLWKSLTRGSQNERLFTPAKIEVRSIPIKTKRTPFLAFLKTVTIDCVSYLFQGYPLYIYI